MNDKVKSFNACDKGTEQALSLAKGMSKRLAVKLSDDEFEQLARTGGDKDTSRVDRHCRALMRGENPPELLLAITLKVPQHFLMKKVFGREWDGSFVTIDRKRLAKAREKLSGEIRNCLDAERCSSGAFVIEALGKATFEHLGKFHFRGSFPVEPHLHGVIAIRLRDGETAEEARKTVRANLQSAFHKGKYETDKAKRIQSRLQLAKRIATYITPANERRPLTMAEAVKYLEGRASGRVKVQYAYERVSQSGEISSWVTYIGKHIANPRNLLWGDVPCFAFSWGTGY
ncbi:hypothetical protein [Grimontia hollisae]|uniref:hypothetical protein n=1 Tax=Grimontia hollisae TaxID=673 RepID=UPI0013030C3C|nr:hypothetical protein [Grimontia hollisae]